MKPPILQGFCFLLAFSFYLFSKGKERKFFLIMISPEVRYKFRIRVLILLTVIKWAFPPYLSFSLIKKIVCTSLLLLKFSPSSKFRNIFSWVWKPFLWKAVSSFPPARGKDLKYNENCSCYDIGNVLDMNNSKYRRPVEKGAPLFIIGWSVIRSSHHDI